MVKDKNLIDFMPLMSIPMSTYCDFFPEKNVFILCLKIMFGSTDLLISLSIKIQWPNLGTRWNISKNASFLPPYGMRNHISWNKFLEYFSINKETFGLKCNWTLVVINIINLRSAHGYLSLKINKILITDIIV